MLLYSDSKQKVIQKLERGCREDLIAFQYKLIEESKGRRKETPERILKGF